MQSVYARIRFPELMLEASGFDCAITACAVYEGQRILQASSHALTEGVLPGMTPSMAMTLCPTLQLIQLDHNKQRRLLNQLALWAYQYSHQVAIRQHGLVLEVSKSESLFGDLEHIANTLRTQAGRPIQLAFGTTPEMAELFLRQTCCPKTSDFDHVVANSPITASGLKQTHVRRLHHMGFQTLGEYFSAPSRARQSRLPQDAFLHLEAVRGRHTQPINWFQPPTAFRQSLEFIRGLESQEMLRFPMRRLTQDAATWLRQQQTATSLLLWQLRLESQRTETHSIQLNSPQTDAQALFDPTWLYFMQYAIDSPIVEISLHLKECTQARPRAGDLFQKQDATDRAQLLDRLTARLGSSAIKTPCRLQDPRPEKANQLQTGQSSTTLPALPPRPIWICNPPKPLGETPETAGHQLLSGPERLESGWWDFEPACRRYWISQTTDHRVAWLYEERHTNTWWLAGWFI
jgi:protein ImuB